MWKNMKHCKVLESFSRKNSEFKSFYLTFFMGNDSVTNICIFLLKPLNRQLCIKHYHAFVQNCHFLHHFWLSHGSTHQLCSYLNNGRCLHQRRLYWLRLKTGRKTVWRIWFDCSELAGIPFHNHQCGFLLSWPAI